MRDGNLVAVDWIAVVGGDATGRGGGLEVRDDLVAVEIEVDPVVGAAAFRAAEDGCVEVARGVEVVDRKGDVKGLDGHTKMIPSSGKLYRGGLLKNYLCPKREHYGKLFPLPIKASGGACGSRTTS